MNTYECCCIVWEYLADDDIRHNTFEITKYIEARDEYAAEDILCSWVYSIWPEADIDEITII